MSYQKEFVSSKLDNLRKDVLQNNNNYYSNNNNHKNNYI